MSSKKRSGFQPDSWQQALQAVDQDILDLIWKRSELIKNLSRDRQKQGQGMVDSRQEKELWRIWQHFFQQKGLQEYIGRKIFNLLNNLGYEALEKAEEKEFLIQPPREEVQIDQAGPKDVLLTRMVLALAAGDNIALQVSQAVLNDALFEFIKASNQAGAGFSWDKEQVQHSPGNGLDFNRKSLFVGQDRLNLFLLLFLACNNAASCKFSGASRLKLESLEQLQGLILHMGARTVSLLPGGQGLPLRLEASGFINQVLSVPEQHPGRETAAALILALSCQQAGTEDRSVICPRDFFEYGCELATLKYILGDRLEVNEQQQEVRIKQKSSPALEGLEIYLDPLLCAPFLALPQILGGRAVFRGYFPQELPVGRSVLELLNQCGVSLEVEQTKVSGSFGQRKSKLDLDCRLYPDLLPLALGLSLALNQPAQLRISPGAKLEFGLLVLQKLGVEHHLEQDMLSMEAKPEVQAEPLHISSPDPVWSMALALIALSGKKIIIRNPGEMTRLWPQFWSLYRNCTLSRGQRNTQREAKHASRKRRRILG